MTRWARGNTAPGRKDFVTYASRGMSLGRAGLSRVARSLVRIASCEWGAIAPMSLMYCHTEGHHERFCL